MADSTSNTGFDPRTNAKQAIDFLTLCQNLKTTKRTGWVKRSVTSSESIADHMYRMGVMALVVDAHSAGVDRDRCVRMAIVHDMAEALVGDITPYCGVSPADKAQMESEALESMCRTLGPGTSADDIHSLWLEYEAGSTPEARLVKDFDKVEMILQAAEYEEVQPVELEEFFESTKGKFKTEIGKAWAAEVVARWKASRDRRAANGLA